MPGRPYVLDSKLDRIPQKGEEFNESFVFQDQATGRLTRRLTTYRQFNQKPTYHLNDGFSKDMRHLCFMTWNPKGGSALVRANIETGDCKVINSSKPGEEPGFRGHGFQIIPDTNLVSLGGQDLIFYDISSMQKQIVYKNKSSDKTRYSRVVGSCDGKTYAWPYKGLKGIEQSHFIGNGEHFIGVADLNGNVVWEHTYPVYAYGHVSAHTQKDVIIVDNLISYEYLSGIHWDNLNSDGLPMIEVLAKHNST